ncbi:uncharacterized protein LOC133376379 [Rhineura floridana]|uniref:uncharacterized protein LOC133376379 n=1 Tax=Rhineura floridana TaxID=261503 RepID=UPI002AC82274|nr:uncharacterized protein LOC133376379 [Rhineura floridana]
MATFAFWLRVKSRWGLLFASGIQCQSSVVCVKRRAWVCACAGVCVRARVLLFEREPRRCSAKAEGKSLFRSFAFLTSSPLAVGGGGSRRTPPSPGYDLPPDLLEWRRQQQQSLRRPSRLAQIFAAAPSAPTAAAPHLNAQLRLPGRVGGTLRRAASAFFGAGGARVFAAPFSPFFLTAVPQLGRFLRAPFKGRRRVPPRPGSGGGQDDPLRVRAAAVPVRGALGGGPQAAAAIYCSCLWMKFSDGLSSKELVQLHDAQLKSLWKSQKLLKEQIQGLKKKDRLHAEINIVEGIMRSVKEILKESDIPGENKDAIIGHISFKRSLPETDPGLSYCRK